MITIMRYLKKNFSFIILNPLKKWHSFPSLCIFAILTHLFIIQYLTTITKSVILKYLLQNLIFFYNQIKKVIFFIFYFFCCVFSCKLLFFLHLHSSQTQILKKIKLETLFLFLYKNL